MADFSGSKAYNKKLKAKGLTKLKYYCQVCEKACRDANGFKCHLEGESHRRKYEAFQGAEGKIVDQWTKEFEKGFMDILSRRFR